jgi:hypothetical protein
VIIRTLKIFPGKEKHMRTQGLCIKAILVVIVALLEVMASQVFGLTITTPNTIYDGNDRVLNEEIIVTGVPNVTIKNFVLTSGWSIRATNDVNLTVKDCVFWGCDRAGFFENCSGLKIINCKATGFKQDGICLNNCLDADIEWNDVYDPNLSDPTAHVDGFQWWGTVKGAKFLHNCVSGTGQLFYVSSPVGTSPMPFVDGIEIAYNVFYGGGYPYSAAAIFFDGRGRLASISNVFMHDNTFGDCGGSPRIAEAAIYGTNIKNITMINSKCFALPWDSKALSVDTGATNVSEVNTTLGAPAIPAYPVYFEPNTLPVITPVCPPCPNYPPTPAAIPKLLRIQADRKLNVTAAITLDDTVCSWKIAPSQKGKTLIHHVMIENKLYEVTIVVI